MERPIDTNALYRNLYAMELSQVKLRAHFVEKMRQTEHGVAWIYTDREEMLALGDDTCSISRGMVSTMNDLAGISIWVNFTESDTGVLCELRSDRFNINPVAVKYGGGGHKKASGATLRDHAQAMEMLRDLDTMAEDNA